MLELDPEQLARRQLRIDRKRTARFPHLLAHKARRMMVSPLAFLRGSAPLFCEVLAARPKLADGPPGEGWLVGDAHLENFGAYRAGALSVRDTKQSHAAEPVVFDLNDFDEAAVGPFRLDVLRLTTSVLLGARESGADGTRSLELSEALMNGYAGAAFGRRTSLPPPPPAVAALVARVRQRTRRQLLDARTEIAHHHERRFVRGDHFEELAPKLR
ncbi:MAG: DUF2252 domain-containing protein, partial [Polyangiaceae bacterium]|nr:DUF2252 domain-containing protein [Polyangiaceae bacterium]